jgi:hypothetical protein
MRSLNGFNLVAGMVMDWRGGGKWQCERCNEYPEGSQGYVCVSSKCHRWVCAE